MRQAVIDNLESSQRLFAALERRRQRELPGAGGDARREPDAQGGARHLRMRRSSDERRHRTVQLFTTITSELEKVAARVEADAIVAVDIAAEHAGGGGPAGGSRGRAAAP